MSRLLRMPLAYRILSRAVDGMGATWTARCSLLGFNSEPRTIRALSSTAVDSNNPARYSVDMNLVKEVLANMQSSSSSSSSSSGSSSSKEAPTPDSFSMHISMNKQLLETKTSEDLLNALSSASVSMLNAVNLSTALLQLHRLKVCAPSSLQTALLRRTRSLFDAIRSRELANIFSALHRLNWEKVQGNHPLWKSVLSGLTDRFCVLTKHISNRGHCAIVQAMAQLSIENDRAWALAFEGSVARADALPAQAVTNLLFALRLVHEKLLVSANLHMTNAIVSLCQRLLNCISDFNSADVSSAFRALAVLGVSSRPVIAALSERAIELAPKANAADLAFILASLDAFKGAAVDREVVETLCRNVSDRIEDVPQHLLLALHNHMLSLSGSPRTAASDRVQEYIRSMKMPPLSSSPKTLCSNNGRAYNLVHANRRILPLAPEEEEDDDDDDNNETKQSTNARGRMQANAGVGSMETAVSIGEGDSVASLCSHLSHTCSSGVYEQVCNILLPRVESQLSLADLVLVLEALARAPALNGHLLEKISRRLLLSSLSFLSFAQLSSIVLAYRQLRVHEPRLFMQLTSLVRTRLRMRTAPLPSSCPSSDATPEKSLSPLCSFAFDIAELSDSSAREVSLLVSELLLWLPATASGAPAGVSLHNLSQLGHALALTKALTPEFVDLLLRSLYAASEKGAEPEQQTKHSSALLTRCFRVLLAWQLEYEHMDKATAAVLPAILEKQMKASHLARRRPRPSRFQALVSRNLHELGHVHEIEYSVDALYVFVDVMLPDLNVIVEVDGPDHKLRGRARQYKNATMLGQYRLRQRLLNALGYVVVNVELSHWIQMRSSESRLQWLRSALERAEQRLSALLRPRLPTNRK